MSTTVQKIDWNSVVKQMAADKKRLEAALRGNKKALNESTFIHPFAVPAN